MNLQCWKSTRRRERKCNLWILAAVQLILIGIFVLYGSINNSPNDTADSGDQTYRMNDLPSGKSRKYVQFITNKAATKSALEMQTMDMPERLTSHQPFLEAYFECRTGRAENFTAAATFCFGNSSIRPVAPHLQKFVDSMDEDEEDCVCKCQEHFHGKDCSQPEVMWRAFMARKLSQDDSSHDVEPQPGRIFYFIDSSALTLTTVEMQFMELHDLIDLLVLCDEIQNNTNAMHGVSSKRERFRYHQMSGEHDNGFFLNRWKQKILILESMEKCSSKQSYKLFRKYMSTMDESKRLEPSDILLFSASDEIVSRSAIQYLKWNSNCLKFQSIRFRLKYNVYGFYWQHPEKTVLSSAVCQLHMLEKRYRNDVAALVNATNDVMIIGDLNHYGGWFCQYCYDSTDNIMQKIQHDRMIHPKPLNAISSKHEIEKEERQELNRYDSTSIESLISAGVYIDGKLELMRLHRYSEKCYAPNVVISQDLKYESMLTNTYAHYDNDLEE